MDRTEQIRPCGAIKQIFLLFLSLLCLGEAKAQITEIDDKYIDNDVISLTGKEGFTFRTRNSSFILKPYVLIQASGNFNYYDDEDLDLSEVDRVANSGFAIPNALLGFSGKAFGQIGRAHG